MTTNSETCSVPKCGKPSQGRAALCSGHLKRRQRNQSLETELRPYGMSKAEAMVKAAKRYEDAKAEDDAEFRRARDLLRKHGAPKRRSVH